LQYSIEQEYLKSVINCRRYKFLFSGFILVWYHSKTISKECCCHFWRIFTL